MRHNCREITRIVMLYKCSLKGAGRASEVHSGRGGEERFQLRRMRFQIRFMTPFSVVALGFQ